MDRPQPQLSLREKLMDYAIITVVILFLIVCLSEQIMEVQNPQLANERHFRENPLLYAVLTFFERLGQLPDSNGSSRGGSMSGGSMSNGSIPDDMRNLVQDIHDNISDDSRISVLKQYLEQILHGEKADMDMFYEDLNTNFSEEMDMLHEFIQSNSKPVELPSSIWKALHDEYIASKKNSTGGKRRTLRKLRKTRRMNRKSKRSYKNRK